MGIRLLFFSSEKNIVSHPHREPAQKKRDQCMNFGVRQTDKHFDMEQLLEVKPPQREASGKVPLD